MRGRIRHEMFEIVMARVSAIACGYKDAIDLDRLRHDQLMKVAVGRCPTTGAPLASQSTISRLENAPSRTEAARLTAALIDQAGMTVKPGKREVLDIDDTFCAAHGGQRLELARQIVRRAPGAYQLDHLSAKLRCVGWSRLRHRELLERKCSGVPARNLGNMRASRSGSQVRRQAAR
jgi:Transposase DDE domain group 1